MSGFEVRPTGPRSGPFLGRPKIALGGVISASMTPRMSEGAPRSLALINGLRDGRMPLRRVWRVLFAGRDGEDYMPNVASVLRQEIQRLSKKEARKATALLRKDNARLKRDVADLKRRVAELERHSRRSLSEVARLRRKTIDPQAKKVKEARLGPKLVAALRRRLKLNRENFAKLVGVSAHTIQNWERGVTSPRLEAKAALVELRGIGVREAAKRLAEIG
jgi:DNA-binding transcriptional regulator YiaG